jgi:DNA-binding transcriptional MocR family regulator
MNIGKWFTHRLAGVVKHFTTSLTASSNMATINLLRGWPSPSLLPIAQVKTAAQIALDDPNTAVSALLYGPNPGYQPLREEIAKWLSNFYGSTNEPQRLCITGGASQNLACILQVFTDPLYTQRIWMVTPCYFLACRIFVDSGFHNRLRAVPEDEEGIDVNYLERKIRETFANPPANGKMVKCVLF